MTHKYRTAEKNKQQANFRRSQKGMGLIAMSLILVIAVFFATAALKVGPSYAEFWTISKIADSTASNSDLLRGSKSKVYESIQKSFTQNNLWDAKAEERITLAKDGAKGMSVTVDYESRTKLFGNIHVVTTFNKEASNQAN